INVCVMNLHVMHSSTRDYRPESGTYRMLVFLLLPLLAYGKDWNYDPTSPLGPANWKEKYPTCGGQNQSPIEIRAMDTLIDPNRTPLFLLNDRKRLTGATLTNIGDGVLMTIPTKHYLVFYDLGALPGQYRVHESIFKWPAEHIIDGEQKPLELQIMTWNTNMYVEYKDAVGKPNGRAIFSVLFTVYNHMESPRLYLDDGLKKLNTTLYSITNPGDEAQIDDDSNTYYELRNSMPAPDYFKDRYYRYNGSLSSPSCDEGILRIVFKENRFIADIQFEAFRRLKGSDGSPTLDGLSRPVQSLNEREVTR
ncbi:unnamed protein product, partial [Owenia fusiformis]